jgi:hypothetical protein
MLKDGSTTMAVIYFLTAQLQPRNNEDFAHVAQNVSKLRDEKIIYIYKPDE